MKHTKPNIEGRWYTPWISGNAVLKKSNLVKRVLICNVENEDRVLIVDMLVQKHDKKGYCTVPDCEDCEGYCCRDCEHGECVCSKNQGDFR